MLKYRQTLLKAFALYLVLFFLCPISSAETISIGRTLTTWDGQETDIPSVITEIEGGYSVNLLNTIYEINISKGYDTYSYPNGTYVSANIFPHLNRWTTQGTDRWVEIIPSSRYIYRDGNNIYLNMTMYEGGFLNITYTVLDTKIKYTWDFKSGTDYNYSIDFQIHGSASQDVSMDTKKYTPNWFNNKTIYDFSDIQEPYASNVSHSIDTNNKIMYQRIVLGQMVIGTRIIIDPTIQIITPYTQILGDNSVCLETPNTVDATSTSLYLTDYASIACRTYIRYNLSSIPAGTTINNATLFLNINTVGTTANVSAYHDTNNTWVNNTLTWNKQSCPTYGCNTTAESTNAAINSAGWKNLSVTNMVTSAYNSGYNNVSVFLKTPETGSNSLTAFRTMDYLLSVSHYLNVTYSPAPDIYTPAPISCTSTKSSAVFGNFWINSTCNAGVGNITDTFNKTVNGAWYNNSDNFLNNTGLVGHDYSNVTFYAYNYTYGLNQTGASVSTQVDNNNPIQYITNNGNNISGLITINELDTLNIELHSSDIDGDELINASNFHTNNSNFSQSINLFTWYFANGTNGTYYALFNTTDGWGGEVNESVAIIVNPFMPALPTCTLWNDYTDSVIMTLTVPVGTTVSFRCTSEQLATAFWEGAISE